MENPTKSRLFIIFILLILLIISCVKISQNVSNSKDEYLKNGESRLYSYKDEQHAFTNNEKQLIISRLSNLNIFENENIEIDSLGQIIISTNSFDFDSFGYMVLFINSSPDKLIELLIKEYGKEILSDNGSITLEDSEGTIRFYRDISGKYRLTFVSKLPFTYKLDEIKYQSDFTQYFLNLNEKNIKKSTN